MDATKNTGQVARIDGTIGTELQWQQRLSYDTLGRLEKVAEHRGDNLSTMSYQLSFGYDRYGNRYQQSSQQVTPPTEVKPVLNSEINPQTNRFTNGVTYDDAGNVKTDQKFRSMRYEYDANARMKRAHLIGGGGETTSVYDGLGQRVQSTNSGVVTNLVYDAFGQLVAEYRATATQGSGGVTYLASDQQGSIRVVMDNAGTIIGRRDYQPFGEEIPASIGKRTTAQGYSANLSARQQYAGMEKESSGLNHTAWRTQESRAGRWTTPDPYNGSMRPSNPQSFNRYSYVGNDPINRIDPNGLDDTPSIGTFSAGNIYSGGNDPLVYPTLNISNVIRLRPMMTLQTKRPRISSQEKPLSKELINAAKQGLIKCIDKGHEQHMKALDALGTGAKGITIIDDPKRGLFVGFVGAVFQVIRKGGKIALAPTVSGALGAIGLDAALNALYNGVSYHASLFDLLEARDTEILNCHAINEERYGVSFRPYNSNSSFFSLIRPRRVPGANSW